MTDVNTVAFRFDAIDTTKQDVRVKHNTGNLSNEIIGERVGLLPLHLSKDDLVGFKPTSWRFELDAENKGTKPVDVTTEAFVAVPLDESDTKTPTFFKPDKLTKRYPIITVLMPNQRLSLEAAASFGSGHEHARFSPVAACVMFPERDEAAVQRERKKREDKATFDALDAKRMIDVDDKGDPKSFRFALESQCGMSPEEIVEAGFEALASRLRTLADATDGAGKVTEVSPQTGSPPDIVSLKLIDEDHTAASIIQDKLLEITDFAGYYIPHQLERSVVFRIKVPTGATARGMLKEACEAAADACEAVLSEWLKIAKKK